MFVNCFAVWFASQYSIFIAEQSLKYSNNKCTKNTKYTPPVHRIPPNCVCANCQRFYTLQYSKIYFFPSCRRWDARRLTFKGHSDTSIYVSICITVGIDDIIGERWTHYAPAVNGALPGYGMETRVIHIQLYYVVADDTNRTSTS